MKLFLQNFLASLARQIIRKYNPIVIGITGSVGKTSTKEAVFCVVAEKYFARKPEKNFNNEIGLPLTIIGSNSPGRNPFKWLAVFIKAAGLISIKQQYPQVLVLEMGVDRPGDMDYLISIAKPHISIITSIGISHYEFFKSEEAIEKEKGKLAECLTSDDFLLLNAEDPVTLRQRHKTKAKVITYGPTGHSDVYLENIRESLALPVKTCFDAIMPTRRTSACINAIGESHLQSITAALAVSEALQINPVAISKGISKYKPAPGRLNVIAGIKHTVIIDDTYNAAPHSVVSALNILAKMPQPHKIAALGDMLELGALSDEQHSNIGKLVATMGIDKLLAVGANGKIIAQAAKNSGMDANRVISFDRSEDAAKFLQEILLSESAILIKGSQGARMEKITKEIMAEPMRASELLCRQYGKWLN